MALLHAQRHALLRWMMATVFLDSVVATYRDEASFPQDVYEFTDTLCDTARHASRRAVEAATQFENGAKVRMVSVDSLEAMALSQRWLRGTWSMYVLVASVYEQESREWTTDAIPQKFQQLVGRELTQARPHFEAFRYLQSEWRSTKLASGQVDLIREARLHIEALYVTLQRLWAPYLYGGQYAQILNQKPTLAELGLTNPWILTDPQLETVKKGSGVEQKALEDFWGEVRDPEKVMHLATQVNALLASRHLRRRTGRGYGTVVPYSSQYLVRRSFVLEGVTYAAGDLVAFFAKRGQDAKFDVSLRRVGTLSHLLDLLGIR